MVELKDLRETLKRKMRCHYARNVVDEVFDEFEEI
jgi:hypothetical protein